MREFARVPLPMDAPSPYGAGAVLETERLLGDRVTAFDPAEPLPRRRTHNCNLAARSPDVNLPLLRSGRIVASSDGTRACHTGPCRAKQLLLKFMRQA